MARGKARQTDETGGNGDLKSFVQRISTLEGEKKETADEIKSVYAEAKDKGFNVKALKHAVKVYMADDVERMAAVATLDTLDTYLNALGILADTELGKAAARLHAAGASVTIHKSKDMHA